MTFRPDPNIIVRFDNIPAQDATGAWVWRRGPGFQGEYLGTDGQWRAVDAGVITEPYLVLPGQIVGSFVAAVVEWWRERSTDPGTEAKVLRESLEVERGRVNHLLGIAR